MQIVQSIATQDRVYIVYTIFLWNSTVLVYVFIYVIAVILSIF